MATRKTVPAAAKAFAKGGLLAKISSFVRFGPFTRESKLGLGVVAAVLVLYAAYLWFLQQSGKKKGALPCACGRLGSCVVCSPLLPLLPLPRPPPAAPKAKAAAAKPPASPKRAKSPAAKKAPAAAAASSSPAVAKSSSPPSGTRRTRSKTPSKKTK